MAPLAMGPFGFQELLIILVILVFLFGAKKIPDMARGLGEGIHGFRTSLKGPDSDDGDSDEANQETPKSSEG